MNCRAVLRDLRLYEDIWWPFVAVAAALMFCYGPAIALAFSVPWRAAAAATLGAGLALLGTFLLPALLLTLITSGSLANLRPDRLLRVIHLCGKAYLGVAALFVGAAIPYLWGLLTIVIQEARLVGITVNLPKWSVSLWLGLPMLCVGIFGMHFFCWNVGLLYRGYQERFPWVLRFHTPDRRAGSAPQAELCHAAYDVSEPLAVPWLTMLCSGSVTVNVLPWPGVL